MASDQRPDAASAPSAATQPDPSLIPQPSIAKPRDRFRFWLFPVCVALLSLGYLGGAWGPYIDDINMTLRNPATGMNDWSGGPFDERPYFYRPLLQLQWYYVQGPMWDFLRLHHAFTVLCHAAATLLLFTLARTLRLARLPAAVGALAFFVFPLHFETVFWSSAITMSQAVAVLLALALLVIWFLRRSGAWWSLPLMTLVAFVIPCLYEQPAMLILAFPLLLPAAGVRLDRAGVIRALVATFFCGIAVLLYTFLLVTTAPPWVRGGTSTFVTLSELPDRVRTVLGGISFVYGPMLAHGWQGGFATGWEILQSPEGFLALAGVAMAGGLWLLSAARADDTPARRSSAVWGVPALALAMAILAWAPMVPIRGQIVETRSTYAASIGPALLLAWIAHMLIRAAATLRFATPARLIFSALAVLGSAAGSVVMVGYQRLFQARTDADAAQAAALAAAFPNVPPDTFFVPLDERWTPTRSGFPLFDLSVCSWTLPSGAAWSLRHAMGRNDIHATTFNPWVVPGRFMDNITPDDFRYTLPGPAPASFAHPEGGSRIPWNLAVPFWIDSDGTLRIADRLFVERHDGNDFVVTPALVGPALAASPATPRGSFTLPAFGTPEPGVPLGGWASSDPTKPLPEFDAYTFGSQQPRRALRMYPHGMMGLPDTALAQLPAADAPRRLVFRATFDPAELDRCRSCDPIRVIVAAGEGPEAPTAELLIDPATIAAERRWPALVLEVPPSPTPVPLRLRVVADTPGPGLYPSVLVTTGLAFPVEP